MILFLSPRLLITLFMLYSLGSLAQSTTKTARNSTTKPRTVSPSPTYQDDITIADTLRLATEYEPANYKKPISDFLLELEATAPADSVVKADTVAGSASAVSKPALSIHQPAVYIQTQSEPRQPVFHPVAGRANSPAPRPLPDKAESDLERILNRKKQVN